MEEEYKLLNEIVAEDVKELERIKSLKYGNIVPIVNEVFTNRVKRLFYDGNYNIKRPMSRENVIKYVLNFYQYLDPKMYEKAKSIIINLLDSDILIAIYDDKTKESLPNDEGFPKYVEDSRATSIYEDIYINSNMDTRRIQTRKAKVYHKLEGTTQDIYVLSHEIAHTFYFNPDNMNYNETERLFSEVNPKLTELFLNDFLMKEGITTEAEVLHRIAEDFSYNKSIATVNHLKIELAKKKEEKTEIHKDDIEQVLRDNRFIVSDTSVNNFIERIINYNYKINTVYVIADLLAPYIYDICANQPENRERIHNQFILGIKEDNLEKALSAIDLKLDEESLEKVIQYKNLQRDNLQRRINDIKFESER